MEVTAANDGGAGARPPSANRHEVVAGGLAASLATAVAAATLLVSHRYFFTDDYTTYFTPGFREIARLLARGEFPLLTDRIWNGGALLQEYQYAVFNPVSMTLYALIGRLNDLALAASIFSLAHIFILAAGAYFVCRVLGAARRHAFLAAVLTPLSDWIFFWGATDWIPGLVSMAWLVWAWGFLILTFRRPAFAPAAAIAVALTIVSGWPFADLALLVSVLVAGRVLLASRPREHLRASAWVAVAIGTGGLLAAPAIAPLEFYVAFTRTPAVDSLWGTDLTGLLEFGMPFVQLRWGSFGGDIVAVRQPIVFVAWFAPLVLASADWKRLVQSRAVWVILGSAGAFAALSMISHIGLLRWMFRLLPYYQFAILVLVALALTRADEDGQTWSFDRMALVIAAEVWLAFSQAHQLAFVYVGVGYVFGLLAWISLRFKGRRDVRWTALALVTSIALFWLTAWSTAIGGYPQFPATWKPPTFATSAARTDVGGPTRFEAVHRLPEESDPGARFWSAYGYGNMALNRPGLSIVGYSPVATPALGGLLCLTKPGKPCGPLIPHATAPVPPTGLSLIDLMGVDQVVIQEGPDAQTFAAWAGANWAQTRGAAGEWRFTRVKPVGLVTWTTPAVVAKVVSRTPAQIDIDVGNPAPSQGTLALARAWYPGWSARLNGAPVVARPLAGLLVSVVLPPHSQGRLEVSFWPSGLTLGLVLAAIGAALLTTAVLFPRLIEAPVETLGAAPGIHRKHQTTA